jgi:hypothetical protein
MAQVDGWLLVTKALSCVTLVHSKTLIKQIWAETEPYGLQLCHHPLYTWLPKPQGYGDFPLMDLSGWLPSIWQFLNRANLKIFIRKAYVPQLQRKHDIALMDFFHSLKYKPAVLKTLNSCRLYLQVIFLSDITTASGTEIEDDAKQGKHFLDRESMLGWPTKQRPSPLAWKQWQEALRYLEEGPRLKKPLGDWISATHQRWQWFFHREERELYKLSPNGWEHFPKYQRNQQQKTRASENGQYSTYSSTSDPPAGILLPASIKIARNTNNTAIAVTHSSNPFPPAEEPPVPTHLRVRENKITPHPYYKYLLDQMDHLNMEKLSDIGEAIRYKDLYTKAKERRHLQEKVAAEYAEYTNDNFLISQNFRYLFTKKSLEERQAMDCDGIMCWLRTVTEAKKEQQMFRERLSKMAAKFFIPRTSTRNSTSCKARKGEKNSTRSESCKPSVVQDTEEVDKQSQIQESDLTASVPLDPPWPP